MQVKMLAVVFIAALSLAAGCAAQERSADPDGTESLRPVVYPSGAAMKYQEDKVIKKQLQVTTQWQTVTFDEPLKINRRGLMGLHLVVDKAPYISTMDDHPLNPECNKPECAINIASLRRLRDGVIVRPEIILVGDNGMELKIRPAGNLYPFFDRSVMTVGLGYFKDPNAFAPPLPEGIKAFTSMRIRGTEPFTVRYLWWKVDRYPYFNAS